MSGIVVLQVFDLCHIHVHVASHDQQDLSHDQTLRPQDQLSESHDYLSQSSSSTTCFTEDSIDMEDVRTALDSFVIEGESTRSDGGLMGSKKSGGIGRSVSAEVMGKKQNSSINGESMMIST